MNSIWTCSEDDELIVRKAALWTSTFVFNAINSGMPTMSLVNFFSRCGLDVLFAKSEILEYSSLSYE